MQVRIFTVLFFLAVSALPGRAGVGAMDFNDGEGFRFRVSWGVFRTAGTLFVQAQHEETAGKPRLRIVTETKTYGVIRAFYPFDGYSDCLFDNADGRLLTAFATTKTSSKETNAMAVVDYPAKKVRYEDRVDKTRTEVLTLPEGKPMDMITTLLCARHWDMKPGEKTDVTVMFDKDFYDLTIYAERYEKVDTDQGRLDALVLTPKMEKNPRGMFKRGGQVHIWVTNDERRLPVKLQVQLKFGTGTAYLTEYTAGEAPKSRAEVASK